MIQGRLLYLFENRGEIILSLQEGCEDETRTSIKQGAQYCFSIDTPEILLIPVLPTSSGLWRIIHAHPLQCQSHCIAVICLHLSHKITKKFLRDMNEHFYLCTPALRLVYIQCTVNEETIQEQEIVRKMFSFLSLGEKYIIFDFLTS